MFTNPGKTVGVWSVVMAMLGFVHASSDAALLAEYLFNGNTVDTSGNSQHGTAYHMTLTEDRFGNPDAAYEFNGISSYMVTPVSGDWRPASFSVWFKADRVDHWHAIVDSDLQSHWGHSLWIGYPDMDGTLQIQHHNAPAQTGYAVEKDRWYHAAVVYSNSAMEMWIDGVLEYQAPYGPVTLDGWVMKLGYHNASHPFWFDGVIDDVRFYNHALDAGEIQNLFTEGTATSAIPAPLAIVAGGVMLLLCHKRNRIA